MLNWIACYLSGRHEYGISCHSGAIFLQCAHCGRRSVGWSIDLRAHGHGAPTAPVAKTLTKTPRVLPFDRAVAN
ncbi:MAG TPA: hypothetical protein VGY57_03360 [Vicinamibacterales bacterium]|jgi:hypothetical protein|nr:hypothetical protein [Vicinamibacterales bacterium]